MLKMISLLILLCGFYSCTFSVPHSDEGMVSEGDSAVSQDSSYAFDNTVVKNPDSVRQDNTQNKDTNASISSTVIDVKNLHPHELVTYAKTLIGVPYRYGSTDPKAGFDCSGFITYVFNHFGVSVPRSSIDFTHVGKEIPVAQSKPGDIILFTGTDSTERFVGHMGIVVDHTDSLRFIHATSGKQYGVTITPLNRYYSGRFIKTIRVFEENE